MQSINANLNLAFYGVDTAIIATYRKRTLHVSYLETSQHPSTVADRTENRHERF
jgi:hypothetical protein